MNSAILEQSRTPYAPVAPIAEKQMPDALQPQIALMQLISGAFVTGALHVVAKLKIADLLRDGARTSDQLARETGMNADALYRVLRSCASFGVFQEGAGKTFRLTPVGDLLRTDADGSLCAMAQFIGESWHMRVFGELMHSVRTGETVARRVLGQEIFEFFRDNAAQGATFNHAMTSISKVIAPEVVAAYDFTQLERIVDIGGGHGLLLSAILEANPHLRGTLFDQPHVTDGARATAEAKGVLSRMDFASGDFFQAVPEGADAYLMQHIIHDWADEQAVIILRNCHRAMSPGGKLLLVESVIPEPGVPSLGKIFDLEMMLLPGGRERTKDEFEMLFAEAGFELTRTIPTRTPESIIEGVRC
jgi:SAM-dependent methyltransferase